MTPPLLGAFLGIIVGIVPPLHAIFVTDGGVLNRTVFAAIGACGRASVPLILLCLGAQIYSILMQPKQASKVSQTSTLVIILFLRMLLLPLLSIFIVQSTKSSLGGALASDPMFIVSIMLLATCPTAVNLMMVCQANGCLEGIMGRVLIWQYGFGAIGMVGWGVFILTLATRV